MHGVSDQQREFHPDECGGEWRAVRQTAGGDADDSGGVAEPAGIRATQVIGGSEGEAGEGGIMRRLCL